MKTYAIKKGKHSSGLHFGLNKFKDNFGFVFKIDFEHFEPRNEDDKDVNKLFGFSFGHHHNNSIRLGWLPVLGNESTVELFLYYYNKANPNYRGTFSESGPVIESLGFILKNTFHTCTIADNHVSIEHAGGYSNDTHYLFVKPKFKLGYLLYPYYGGDNTAPVNIKVQIDRF